MRRSSSALVVVCVAIALASCGRSTPGTAQTGIFGSVTVGPSCPVERTGSPCPPRPWSGTVRASDASGRIFETRSDGFGRYTLHLAPGTYAVEAVVSGPLPTAAPATVVVPSGPMQRFDLRLDSGIR
ncbi:MAG TPA: hypothetical protein VK646_01685 [Actinomycetota bacterium]|nr:hypothetical protein [Actinomycetota bacterium]